MLIAGFVYHWPADELGEPLGPGHTNQRAWASSLRLETLRESAEDVEYFITLRDLADKSPADSPTRKLFSQLSEQLNRFLETGRTPYTHNWYYNYRLDEDELLALRRRVCEAIEQGMN